MSLCPDNRATTHKPRTVPREPQRGGDTALAIASKRGHEAVVTKLLKAGANRHIKNVRVTPHALPPPHARVCCAARCASRPVRAEAHTYAPTHSANTASRAMTRRLKGNPRACAHSTPRWQNNGKKASDYALQLNLPIMISARRPPGTIASVKREASPTRHGHTTWATALPPIRSR